MSLDGMVASFWGPPFPTSHVQFPTSHGSRSGAILRGRSFPHCVLAVPKLAFLAAFLSAPASDRLVELAGAILILIDPHARTALQ